MIPPCSASANGVQPTALAAFATGTGEIASPHTNTAAVVRIDASVSTLLGGGRGVVMKP